MTLGGSHPGYGYAPPGPPPPRRLRLRWWPLVMVVAVLGLAAGAGVVVHALTTHERAGGPPPAQNPYRVGECVEVKPAPSGELHAADTACGTDPSYVVSSFIDAAGRCSPDRFDRFPPPFADAQTGTLCLEPNLVAGHCYRFGTPVGMWEVADCNHPTPAVIKVTKRVDADDDNACPNSQDQLAMPYPSPPRTYCTVPAVPP